MNKFNNDIDLMKFLENTCFASSMACIDGEKQYKISLDYADAYCRKNMLYDEEFKFLFDAYKHKNGSLIVKKIVFGESLIDKSSPNVLEYYDKISADSIEEAEKLFNLLYFSEHKQSYPLPEKI